MDDSEGIRFVVGVLSVPVSGCFILLTASEGVTLWSKVGCEPSDLARFGGATVRLDRNAGPLSTRSWVSVRLGATI